MTTHASRRAGTLVVAALAATVALNGCASTDDEGTAATDGAESALIPAAEGETEYPLTLETPYGETTLDERPQRIAVLGGLGEFETVLALGVSPVTMPWEEGAWEWFDPYLDQVADAVYVNPWADSLEIESLAAAEPDLIIAQSYSNLENDWEALSAIAPVLGAEDAADLDWREAAVEVGEALDLTAAAEALVEEADASVADATSDHPEYDGKTVSILINRGEEAGLELVNTAGSSAEELLDVLGFAPQPAAEEVAEADGDVSLENLSLLEADGLLIARHGGYGTPEEADEWLESAAIYQSLQVVQDGRVAHLDPDDDGGLPIAWAFSYPNVLALPWTVEQLTTAFDDLFVS